MSLGSISIKHINIAFCTIIDGLLLHSIPNELGMFWAGFELSKTTDSITIDDDIQNTMYVFLTVHCYLNIVRYTLSAIFIRNL